LYIEGQIIDKLNEEERLELRVDGPNCTEVSKQYWKLYIEINVLCQCAKNNINYHRMRQLTGLARSIFEPCINVYKYGSGVEDTQEFVGVLKRLDDEKGRNNIQVTQFGQVDPVVPVEQSSVEAHYVMFLEE
jgi:hypothetical protein